MSAVVFWGNVFSILKNFVWWGGWGGVYLSAVPMGARKGALDSLELELQAVVGCLPTWLLGWILNGGGISLILFFLWNHTEKLPLYSYSAVCACHKWR